MPLSGGISGSKVDVREIYEVEKFYAYPIWAFDVITNQNKTSLDQAFVALRHVIKTGCDRVALYDF